MDLWNNEQGRRVTGDTTAINTVAMHLCNCGESVSHAALTRWGSAGAGDRMPELSLVLFRRVLIVCVALWLFASIWLGSNSGISVPGLFVIVGGAVLLLVLWLVTFIVSVARKQRLRRRWIEPLVTLVALAAIYSGALFHLRFLASRPFLERYVAQMNAAGASHRKLAHVGLFVARETEVLPNGVVRIITTPCMFDECGVVFSRSKPLVIGEDRYEHVAGNWWRWWRSW